MLIGESILFQPKFLIMSDAVTITVSLKDSSSNPPKLKLRDSLGDDPGDDNLNTEVKKGATVTWVPDISSGISALKGVTKKQNECDLLEADPSPSGNNYVGTVKSDPGDCKKESYLISFTIDGDSSTYSDDPKLSLKT